MRAAVRHCLLAVCAAVTLGLPAVHAAQPPQLAAGNRYESASELQVDRPVDGDLFAAGGKVSVNSDVAEDAAVAGGAVDVRADIRQDLRVAGGEVMLAGTVGGELMAAGGSVRVAEGAVVEGPAHVAGRQVTVDGRLGRGARIYADTIQVRGEIDGAAHLYGRRIVLEPNSRIDGDLYYASPEPLPEEALARVSGRVVREATPPHWEQGAGGPGWFHPFFLVSMLVSGLLLHLLFPRAVDGAAAVLLRSPFACAGIGLAALFAVPLLALLLMMSLVAMPLGVSLLLLYPVLLLFGYLGSAFGLARRLGGAPAQQGGWRRALYLALSLLVLLLLGAIPLVGGLFVFAIVLAGLGSWVLWVAGFRRTPPAAAPAHPDLPHFGGSS